MEREGNMLTVDTNDVSSSCRRYFSNFALFIGAPANSNCMVIVFFPSVLSLSEQCSEIKQMNDRQFR